MHTDFSAFVTVQGIPYACRVYDISPGGARIRLARTSGLTIGGTVEFDLDGYGSIPAIVRHSTADFVGIEFLLEGQKQSALASWLVAWRPARRPERRPCHIEAAFRIAGAQFPCVVTNLSRTGAAITTGDANVLALACELTLLMPKQVPFTALIRYVDGEAVGLMFVDPYPGELPE